MAQFMFLNTSNRSPEDRFIPTRSQVNVDMAHFKLTSSETYNIKTSSDIFSLKKRKSREYRELLQDTFNYDDSPIYSFGCQSVQKKKDKKVSNKINAEWPCIPRKFSVLKKPDIILDWPNVHPVIFWNIVDWGSNGYLATIWSGEVFLWRNKDGGPEEVTDSNIKGFGALKWNHAGTQLAVGHIGGNFSVWAFPERKELFSASCYLELYETCNISVLCWDLTDSILVSGCSKGNIFAWGPEEVSVGCVIAHRGHRVVSLAFNASNKYLCSSGTDGMVRIWNWPTLEPHCEITYFSPVRAIAFHPWRASLLAVGGGVGDGSLSIWNISTCVQVCGHVPEANSVVDCVTWSSVTGELVSSHLLLAAAPGRLRHEETKVLVLAALDRVVDCVEYHKGRVLYLMWDKTGSKLATASSDESLFIWDFLGTKSKNYESSLNREKIHRRSKDGVLSKLEKCIR